MVDFFTDAPARRMALDVDGTRMFKHDGALTTAEEFTSDLAAIQGATQDAYSQKYEQVEDNPGTGTRFYLTLIFPELRDVTHLFAACRQTGTYEQFGDLKNMEISTDTTDGIDGTWVEVMATIETLRANRVASPEYRENIITVPNSLGVRAVRFGCGASTSYSNMYYAFRLQTLHLYGGPSAGENPDRLDFWRPVDDQQVGPAHFDFGDIIEGTSDQTTFRIKNRSATLTAQSVTVANDSIGFPEIDGTIEFSADGTTWATDLAVGDLAPGAISPVLHVRRLTQLGEVTQVSKESRLYADAESWV